METLLQASRQIYHQQGTFTSPWKKGDVPNAEHDPEVMTWGVSQFVLSQIAQLGFTEQTKHNNIIHS